MSKLEELKEFLSENLEVRLSMDSDLRTRRKLQHLSSLKFKDKEFQSLYEMTMKHAHHAEYSCPGSGILFVQKVVGSKMSDRTPLISSKKDLEELIRNLDVSSKAKSLLLESLNYSNSSTKLSIKKSSTSATYVEIAEGYSFSLKALLKTPYTELKNSKVACIDGFVENVSEIHRLMTDVSESKIPCLVFVRGMSDDVLHTISVNLDRKTASVYPFVVPFDIENVNTLVDVAVVSGTDVVSNLKGDLISSVSYSSLGNCQSCIISGGDVRIKNETTRHRVKEHTDNLKSTLTERPELEKILSKRLQSLSSSCIDICLPDDVNFYSMSQQLDEGIRILSAVMKKSYHPDKIAQDAYTAYVKTLEVNQTIFT